MFGKTRRGRASALRLGNEGQAVTEYIMLLAVIISLFLIVARLFKDKRMADTFRKPFTGDYRLAYQNGHPKATSYEDGAPHLHPRAGREDDDTNFRVFFNPEVK